MRRRNDLFKPIIYYPRTVGDMSYIVDYWRQQCRVASGTMLLVLLLVETLVLSASGVCPDVLESNSKPEGAPLAVHDNTPLFECRALCSGSPGCRAFYVVTSSLACFLHSEPAQNDRQHQGIVTLQSDLYIVNRNIRNTRDSLNNAKDSPSHTVDPFSSGDLRSRNTGEHHPRNRNVVVNGDKHVTNIRQSASTKGTLRTADRTQSPPCGPLPLIPNAVTEDVVDGLEGKAACKKGFRNVFTNSSETVVKCNQGQWTIDEFVCSKNVALHKTTHQSSVFRGWVSRKAVDGSWDSTTRGSCSHTALESKTHPWWEVDLNDVYDINYISILNREDCCWQRLSNFTVSLGTTTRVGLVHYKLCLFHPGWFRGVKIFSCDQWTRGRYLRIELSHATPLTLCEVEVFPLYQ